MKKRIFPLLLAAALLLTGCKSGTGDAVSTPEAPAADSAGETAFFVDTAYYGDTARDEDGTELASFSYDLPHMTVMRGESALETASTPEEQAALDTAAAFNASFDSWASAEEFSQVVEAARQDRAMYEEWKSEWIGPYTMELTCTVYQTAHLVSTAGTYFSFTGGAHPNTYLLGWNFDLDTGEFFDVKALSDGTALEDYVTEELIRQARCKAAEADLAPDAFYWEDYESIIAEWSSYAVSFDAGGMIVAFSPYELAAYAAGEQVFTIPYEDLKPHLNQRGLQVLGLEE